MTIPIPTLSTYAASDINYISKLNADRAALISSIQAIDAALGVQLDASGYLYTQDWTRQISGADPLNGVMGAYSLQFVDDDSNKQFRLDDHPVSGKSVAVINGIRCEHAGDLVGDLTTLALADGTYTIYGGVMFLSPGDMTIAYSQTAGDLDLAVWSFELVISGSGATYAIDKVKRVARSMLWDNSIEQLRQEQVEYLSYWIGTTTFVATPVPVPVWIPLPYDCVIDSIFMTAGSITNSDNILKLENQAAGTTYASKTDVQAGYTAGDEIEVALSAAYVGRTFAKDKVMKLSFTQQTSGTSGLISIGMKIRRSFNVSNKIS